MSQTLLKMENNFQLQYMYTGIKLSWQNARIVFLTKYDAFIH